MTTVANVAQFDVNPYPSNLQSGWLPTYGSRSMQTYFDRILNAERKPLAPSVQALGMYIHDNEVVRFLVNDACAENANIIASHVHKDGVPIPRIKDADTLLQGFTTMLTEAPGFIHDELVGLPFSAFVVGIDPTLSGAALFRLPTFNVLMCNILNDWNAFLETPASNVGFRVEGEQWLSPAAKAQYRFDDWETDADRAPYWNSWNAFFTRQFKDRASARPVADPDSNQTVICPNDGSLFRWDAHIARKDAFWFKDMHYSLADILGSPLAQQQALIDEYALVDLFEGGTIFQTYLNPYDFHRWWVPVNGEVLFDPITVPGCFFSKLVLPDFGGATTSSLPYLAQVNARGLIVIKTEDYGHVCCIPLGMSEVSSIAFDPAMKRGARVKKGQEMGMFNYGGSSFAILYEKLPDKELIFVSDQGVPYPMRPVLPSGSAGTGHNVTLIGSQIGVWYHRN